MRLPTEIEGILRATVASSSQTAAAWVRGRICEALGSDPSLAAGYATISPRRPAPSATMLDLVRLRETMAEVAVLLMRVAAASPDTPRRRSEQEMRTALTQLRTAILDVDRAKRVLLDYQR